jgi:shikimate dehydrogenase
VTQKQGYVVGSPISHSRSPDIHLSAYRALGLDWGYQAVDIPKGKLADFMLSLNPSATSVISVTMPLKPEAAELATSCSHLVAELGIANTLLPRGDGWFADNTDVAGLAKTITSTGFEVKAGQPATVLGTGATAMSAIKALGQLGFAQVNLCGRNQGATEKLLAIATAANLRVDLFDPAEVGPLLDSPLVISTWPGDVAGQLVAPTLGSKSAGLGLLVDVTYHPWPSPLARAWFGSGGDVIGGLDLLVNQAMFQIEAATGQSVSLPVLREAVGLPRL